MRAVRPAKWLNQGIGSALSVIFCNRNLDRIYTRMRDAHGGRESSLGRPEFRLPLAVVGALTLPLALALYGWAAELRLPLLLLLLSLVLLGVTLMLALIPLMAYIVDAFGLFSASALTGVIVMRCLMSTFLPLSTGPVIDALGYGWGFTLYAALCLAMAPIPILMLRYGARWRQASKYTRD